MKTVTKLRLNFVSTLKTTLILIRLLRKTLRGIGC